VANEAVNHLLVDAQCKRNTDKAVFASAKHSLIIKQLAPQLTTVHKYEVEQAFFP